MKPTPRPTRRDVLKATAATAAVPAVALYLVARKPDAKREPMESLQSPPSQRSVASRDIEGIYPAPPLHWVGDGFHVAGYFSVIKDAAKKLSPFLLLDYHPPHDYTPTTKRRGVGVHPHRGFETVTLAWKGSVAHHDSTGGGGVIGPGDVQWMSAAAGILHKEYHEESFGRAGGTFHMAQLWVNLPRVHKMGPPRYQPVLAEQMGRVVLPDGGGEVKVIAGSFCGAAGPAQTYSPINVFDLRLNAGATLELDFPATHNVSLLVMEGEVGLDGAASARVNDFVVFGHGGDRITVEARAASHLLLLGGEPIDEPVVQYGPFVMNTEREIREAFADYNAGKFGFLAD